MYYVLAIAILLDSKNVASDYSVLGVIVITHIPALAAWWYSNRNLKRLRKQIACDIPIGMIKKQDQKPFGRYGDAIRITILIISSTTISISKLIKADSLMSEYIFVLAPASVMILFIWWYEYIIWRHNKLVRQWMAEAHEDLNKGE